VSDRPNALPWYRKPYARYGPTNFLLDAVTPLFAPPPKLWDQPAAQRSYRAGSMGAPIVNGVQAPYGPVDFATDAFAKFVVQPLYNIASGNLMRSTAAPRDAVPMSDDPREAMAVQEHNRSNAARALGAGMEAGGMASLGSFGAKAPAGALRSGPARPDAGLDMSQAARLQRAKEMGFDTENVLYHVTESDFPAFDLNKLGRNTDDADYAQALAKVGVWFNDDSASVAARTAMDGNDSRTIPVYVKGDLKDFDDLTSFHENIREHAINKKMADELGQDIREWGYEKGIGSYPLSSNEMKAVVESYRKNAELEGYAGVRLNDEEFGGTSTVIFDPSNIRSVNAAFDPAKASSPNLMAANPFTGAVTPLFAPPPKLWDQPAAQRRNQLPMTF
jgi:hypothetical protein